jgi:trimethylamine---corrinoid protein Co-methyltransferase
MPVLSPDQIARINQGSLRILENAGVRIDHPHIQTMLLEAGATRGLNADTIRIPRELVSEALERAPAVVRLSSLNGTETDLTPNGPTVFWTGNALTLAETRETTPITSESFARLVRVIDRLPNVHGMVGTSLADFPAHSRDFVGVRIMAHNCRKHFRPCIYTPAGSRACIEMAQSLLGGTPLRQRPIVSFGYTCLSPLHWAKEAMELFSKSAGFGAPMMINSEPIAGATAPVTLAGALTLANAECLSGLVIVQMLEPGRPSVLNLGFAHTLDMRSAITRTAGPESGLMAAAGAEIARFHGLPSASWMSNESMVPDAQAAYEQMLTGTLHCLSGVNIVWGVGQLESQRTMSMTQAVIGNEMIDLMLRAQRGIEVTDETMAVELIENLGSKPDYLNQDHTLDHFRHELVDARIACTIRREAWETAGAHTLRQAAVKVVEGILASPPPELLTDEQSRELHRIEAEWMGRTAG